VGVRTPTELRSERLVLRHWRDADRPRFAALNADPVVMENFVAPLDRERSDRLVDLIEEGFGRDGFGLWAVQVAATGRFIGFTGLAPLGFAVRGSAEPVEIGWRLARHAWGHGYATEAARAALADGFARVGLPEVVSVTAVPNVRSQAVMRRLGMTHDPVDDFDHPRVPAGSPLLRHVLYRLTAERWRPARGAG
jgi:ribosomal-protein-alanine N-acetyltransferase